MRLRPDGGIACAVSTEMPQIRLPSTSLPFLRAGFIAASESLLFRNGTDGRFDLLQKRVFGGKGNERSRRKSCDQVFFRLPRVRGLSVALKPRNCCQKPVLQQIAQSKADIRRLMRTAFFRVRGIDRMQRPFLRLNILSSRCGEP